MWQLVTSACYSLWYTTVIGTSEITNMTSLRIFDVTWYKIKVHKICQAVFIRIAAFPLLTSPSKVSHKHLWQRRADSQSWPLFSLYQKLFAASVQSTALRFTAFL